MKIRIKSNSIRLRLTRLEVGELIQNGVYADSISFPNGQSLIYELSEGSERDVRFSNEKIQVFLTIGDLEAWIDEEKVGFEFLLELDDENQLKVIVEKDFKCLVDRAEDEKDNYPNPMA